MPTPPCLTTLDFLRLVVALFYWGSVGITTLMILHDSIQRMRSFHLLVYAFGSLLIGSTSLVVRVFFPNLWTVGLAFSTYFYALAILMFWLHFELLRKERPTQWIQMLSTTAMTMLLIGLWNAIDNHDSHSFSPLFLSFTGLLLLACVTLIKPFIFSLDEYFKYRVKQQFLETIGYLFLLLSAANFYLDFLFDRFNSIYNIITIILGSVGISMMMGAYLFDRAYLYRLPFNMHYLFCVHDSGISFYQRRLIRPDGRDDDHDDTTFLSGMLSAIETIFKKILHEQVNEFKISGENMFLFFKRDPHKKIGIGVITTNVSWYLARSLSYLLTVLPTDLIMEKNDRDTLKALDQFTVDGMITRLVENIFPYFKILEPNSTVESNYAPGSVNEKI